MSRFVALSRCVSSERARTMLSVWRGQRSDVGTESIFSLKRGTTRTEQNRTEQKGEGTQQDEKSNIRCNYTYVRSLHIATVTIEHQLWRASQLCAHMPVGLSSSLHTIRHYTAPDG